MPYNSEITIIGGGIIGLLSAREFVKVGYGVTLIDKSFTGKESSWAGGGILLPLYPWRQPDAISNLVIESIKTYPALSSELFNLTQIDPEWYDCGMLICKNPDIELATNWCDKYNIPYTEANMSFFDNLNTIATNPLWLSSIAQARNPRLLKSLKAYLVNKGVTFIENSVVKDCHIIKDKVNSLLTSKGKINIDQLIICAGAWTGKLMQSLFPYPFDIKISPVKGQMLLFDAEPDTLCQMVLDDDQYLIPRKDGKILVGSSVEYSEFDKSTTTESREKLYTFATKLLPVLKDFPISNHWAGLRPGTQQGIPYIDKHPQIENLWINAGHFRNGLAMGPASAQLITDLILKRKPCVDPEPYRLSSNTNTLV